MCSLEGCDKPVNKDGVCLLHKLKSVSMNTGVFTRERQGRDASGGQGAAAYARSVYEKSRALGREDPIPENKKSARFAPRRKLSEGGVI